jgi:hypothetical protein
MEAEYLSGKEVRQKMDCHEDDTHFSLLEIYKSAQNDEGFLPLDRQSIQVYAECYRKLAGRVHKQLCARWKEGNI